jgi:MFS family permease
VARSLRAFGDGYVAILLPLHLSRLGYDAFGVGVISTATLLGSALLTLAIGLVAYRIPRRRGLLAAGLLMAVTGLGFAGLEGFWPLLVIAFVGTLNPSGGDVSIFLPLEHTVVAHVVADEERTAVFARYSFVGAFFGALGALSVGTVEWLSPLIAPPTTTRILFGLYSVIGLLTFFLYRHLSPQVEAGTDSPPAPLGPSRGIVYRLAALFSVDAFGGGLVINALLSLWLSERFGISVATIGAIFFVTSLCSAVSYFAAVPLARRFGLINTMVFTHLPSSLFLILTAFAPTVWSAFGLLILRSLLSQMDVPTRSSYVMAVVRPEERPAAASVTAVPRSLASAVAPLLSGWLLTLTPFGWPLVLAGTLKAAYDLTLLRQFSAIKPPEER